MLLLYIFGSFLIIVIRMPKMMRMIGLMADDAPLAGLAHQILREDVPVGGNLPLFQEPGALVLQLSLPDFPDLG